MPDVSMSAQSKDRTTDNDTRFVTSDSSRNEDGSDIATVAGGYEHGNFASGRRFDIPLLDRSFCMAYSSPFNFHCNGCARQSTATRAPATPALLAVGTASSLDFYDCQVSGSGSSVYPLVYSLPTTSMISALEWVNDNNYFDEAAAISKEKRLKRRYQKNRIFEQRNETLHDIERQTTWLPTPVTKKRDRPFSTPRRPIVHTQPTGSCRCCCSDNGNVLLLVTATLTGLVSLYNLDRDILESQGPTLLWVRAVHGNAQIRSLAIVVCGFQAAEDNTDEDGIFFDDGDAEITTVQSSTSTSTSSSPSLSHQPDSRRNDGDLVLLVATGDKNGSFIISALQMNVSSSLPFCQVVFLDSIPMFPSHLATQPCCSGAATNRMSGILGLTVQTELGLLAMSTTGGLVQVFTLESLVKIYSTSFRFRNRQSAKAATDVHQDLLQISIVWSMQNNGGAIRAVAFSAASDHLFAYGGYDKKVVLVDTLQWDVSRELHVQGTVNTIAFDLQGRYLGVGCRDKTFVLFDLSTTVAVKVFHTPSWVTSICWTCDAYVAIRSETRCISLLDLSPIQHSSLSHPFGKQGGNCGGSLSWSSNGQYLACSVGSRVSIVDSSLISDDNKEFRSVASFDMTAGGLISQVVFCQAAAKADLVAVIDDSGSLVILRLCVSSGMTAALNVESTVFVEPFLKSLAWSNDGKMLATGGRSKRLHLFSLEKSTLKATKQLELTGRIWDVDFVPSNLHDIGPTPLLLAVALGDYTTVLLDFAFDVKLQISRSLTCRCLKFHPVARVLAIGDGAGMIAVVDYDAGELLMEWDAGGRVNKMEYSPIGDFLIVGTDSCLFSLFESTHYQCVQEMSSHGFALCASFSPNGLHLALGSEKCSYLLIRLGPFLGTDYVPLQLANHPGPFPSWSKESLYRSCNGPSFLQRNMIHGGSDNLRRVSKILLEHPDSIYTFNRASGEGCFDTAMRLQKPGLVKLVVTSLVNGTLNPPNDKEKNFLTTSIPESGRKSLKDIVENYPQDYIVDILQAMVFTKVPFTAPRVVESGERIECGSPLYTDPWIETGAERRQLARSRTSSKLVLRGGSIRTPAVLPVPGLGNIDFLSSLLRVSRADVFDNDAMAVVLRVLWRHHIRKFYYIDCCFFASFYLSWIVFLELVTTSEITNTMNPRTTPTLALVIISLNTMFAAKEVIEAIATKLSVYFGSLWNFCDLVAIASVYAYTLEIFVTGNSHVPLAVCTTLFLTLKLLSYLRGFSSTGWLLSVLGANFRDVRGFLVILGIILAGFSVIFRVLFGATGDESFGSLRRSFLSTFELTVTGTYDTNLLFETQYTFLVVISFVLAITCVLVVALNALISILGESYAKVQQHAVANRRRELASLIVEYMCLLPTWKRRQIEHSVTWFHTLLEVDEDGSLHIETGGGEGGMSALCRDMEELSRLNAQSLEKSLEHLKADINAEMTKFKEELVAKLEDLTDDVKHVRKLQSEGILKFDAKQSVAKVVKAVQLIGRKGRITMIKHDDDD